MQNRITVKVEAEDIGFDPDGVLKNGINGNGFMLLMFDEHGKATLEAMYGVTAMKLAEFIAGTGCETANTIRQAGAIAEGLIRSRDISREYERRATVRETLNVLQ
jgi:hypothetical protein